jgi:hypothetical protein
MGSEHVRGLSIEECELKASECRELAADGALSVQQRVMLRLIADTWLRIADDLTQPK